MLDRLRPQQVDKAPQGETLSGFAPRGVEVCLLRATGREIIPTSARILLAKKDANRREHPHLPAASKQLTYSFSRHRCLFLVPEGPTTDRDLETPYDTGKIDWPVELLSGLNITDESGIPFSIPGRRLIIREIEFVTGFFCEKTKITKMK